MLKRFVPSFYQNLHTNSIEIGELSFLRIKIKIATAYGSYFMNIQTYRTVQIKNQ